MKEYKKGGRLTNDKEILHKKLHALDLFNRDSPAYITIEKELDKLAPARAFNLFCHYCARRAHGGTYDRAYKLDSSCVPEGKKSFRVRVAVENQQCILDAGIVRFAGKPEYDSLFSSLSKLHEIDERTFVTYMELLYIDYMTSHDTDISTTNDFSFELTSSFSWGYLSNYYSEEQQERIYEHIFNEHLQMSEALQEIYEASFDKKSLKALHALMLLDRQRVNVTDVTNNIKSPYYLKDRSALEISLKVNRYRDITYNVSELPPKNSSKPMSYDPDAILHVNMHRPVKYIEEILSVIKDDWVENNSFLGIKEQKKEFEHQKSKLEKDVMRFHKKQKTLAGKLTDLLYVYDCRMFGFTNPWTRDQLHKYWKKKKPKGGHGDSMSSSSHTNYLKLISTMIDKEYYKYY